MAGFDWISLCTDYGYADGFVASCHGVIARIAPHARVLDITHAVTPGDVRRGSVVLADTLPWLPPAVHVAVVDPGVGTARRGVALVSGDAVLVGPDNGLLVPAAQALCGVRAAYELVEPDYRPPTVSATFHGRDVFAPAAAHLARGVPPDALGPATDPASLVTLPPPVCHVDSDRIRLEVLQSPVAQARRRFEPVYRPARGRVDLRRQLTQQRWSRKPTCTQPLLARARPGSTPGSLWPVAGMRSRSSSATPAPMRTGRGTAAEGGDCGIAYVSRQYQLLPGAEKGPTNVQIGSVTTYPGYQAIVFIHDNRTFSTLIARASTDRQLLALRFPAAFEAASRAIPSLAAWTEPDRSRPISPVLPGGRLHNTYRTQLDEAGLVAVHGLIFAGDAVCTTNPAVGRGIATSLMQAQRLVALLDEHRRDFTSCSLEFDRWCAENIKPWFSDHVYWDAELIRRWSGHDVDLTRPLPSDLIMAATEVDPEMLRIVGPYMAMRTLPASLAAVEPRAREIYASGWRPPVPEGPTRDELADHVANCDKHPCRSSGGPLDSDKHPCR